MQYATRFPKQRTLFACLIGAIAIAISPSAHSQQSHNSGAPAEKLSLDGVENFARIDQWLYRGAQPKDFAFNELKNAGVAIVVDFRDENSEVTHEKKVVEGTGMQFVSLPWNSRSGPVHDQIVAFLNLLRQNPEKKVFVHCKRGADRTGLMVALYRITFDQWSVDQAVGEMKEFRYHNLLLPNLERYVRGYPAQLAADPALRGGQAGNRAAQ